MWHSVHPVTTAFRCLTASITVEVACTFRQQWPLSCNGKLQDVGIFSVMIAVSTEYKRFHGHGKSRHEYAIAATPSFQHVARRATWRGLMHPLPR